MRRDNNTRTPPVRAQREPSFDEPIRRWANLPVTQERARQLVDIITRREDSESRDALIVLICGLTPNLPSDDREVLDERSLAGQAALMHAFTDTRRAHNDLGAYVVGLKCAEWD
ncbi:MAG TPA: hypothetical protein VGX24_03355 [Pyrinomonadaceae bacterium]|jgi:hypothetical protein|nr:hypothetical protein [Pyrinomonadaceae bacterium]